MMASKNFIAEVLSAHADQLLRQQKANHNYADLFPNNEDLPPLLNLADHVQAALQPVQPHQTFKDRLQRDLMAAAHLRQAELEARQPPNRQPIYIALMTLVAMGSVLLLWRWRVQSGLLGEQLESSSSSM
jgi:hypothetical protein